MLLVLIKFLLVTLPTFVDGALLCAELALRWRSLRSVAFWSVPTLLNANLGKVRLSLAGERSGKPAQRPQLSKLGARNLDSGCPVETGKLRRTLDQLPDFEKLAEAFQPSIGSEDNILERHSSLFARSAWTPAMKEEGCGLHVAAVRTKFAHHELLRSRKCLQRIRALLLHSCSTTVTPVPPALVLRKRSNVSGGRIWDCRSPHAKPTSPTSCNAALNKRSNLLLNPIRRPVQLHGSQRKVSCGGRCLSTRQSTRSGSRFLRDCWVNVSLSEARYHVLGHAFSHRARSREQGAVFFVRLSHARVGVNTSVRPRPSGK